MDDFTKILTGRNRRSACCFIEAAEVGVLGGWSGVEAIEIVVASVIAEVQRSHGWAFRNRGGTIC